MTSTEQSQGFPGLIYEQPAVPPSGNVMNMDQAIRQILISRHDIELSDWPRIESEAEALIYSRQTSSLEASEPFSSHDAAPGAAVFTRPEAGGSSQTGFSSPEKMTIAEQIDFYNRKIEAIEYGSTRRRGVVTAKLENAKTEAGEIVTLAKTEASEIRATGNNEADSTSASYELNARTAETGKTQEAEARRLEGSKSHAQAEWMISDANSGYDLKLHLATATSKNLFVKNAAKAADEIVREASTQAAAIRSQGQTTSERIKAQAMSRANEIETAARKKARDIIKLANAAANKEYQQIDQETEQELDPYIEKLALLKKLLPDDSTAGNDKQASEQTDKSGKSDSDRSAGGATAAGRKRNTDKTVRRPDIAKRSRHNKVKLLAGVAAASVGAIATGALLLASGDLKAGEALALIEQAGTKTPGMSPDVLDAYQYEIAQATQNKNIAVSGVNIFTNKDGAEAQTNIPYILMALTTAGNSQINGGVLSQEVNAAKDDPTVAFMNELRVRSFTEISKALGIAYDPAKPMPVEDSIVLGLTRGNDIAARLFSNQDRVNSYAPGADPERRNFLTDFYKAWGGFDDNYVNKAVNMSVEWAKGQKNSSDMKGLVQYPASAALFNTAWLKVKEDGTLQSFEKDTPR